MKWTYVPKTSSSIAGTFGILIPVFLNFLPRDSNLSNLTSNSSRDSLAMSSTSSRPQLSARQMQDLRERFTQFRILVIGRANAGKTTILHTLCNATGDPTIFDRRGKKVKYMIQVHARYSHLCPSSQIESSALDPSLEVNGSLLAWY